jgi:Holliday junction resolvase
MIGMKSYAKGYRGERELLHELYRRGWAVMRAPRSGRIGIPCPDLIAIRKNRIIIIECKSRASAFTVEEDQLDQLRDWQTRTGAEAWLGCKLSRRGWKFLTFLDVSANNGNVGMRFLEARGITLDELDGIQNSQLNAHKI